MNSCAGIDPNSRGDYANKQRQHSLLDKMILLSNVDIQHLINLSGRHINYIKEQNTIINEGEKLMLYDFGKLDVLEYK